MRAPFVAVLLATAALGGCLGGATGTLVVQGSDPEDDIADFSSLVVQLGSFAIHRSEGEEHAVSAQVASVDVVKLQGGNLTTLARQDVPAGNYTWIRMGVTGANGTLREGGTVAVEVPSDRLKLNGPFEVRAGSTTSLRIDLHVVKTGNGRYMLSPVIGSVG